MSREVKNFFGKIKSNYNMASKLNSTHQSGARIVPSRTAKNDADYQFRIDAGEVIDDKLYLNLQVNSGPKTTPLKEWLKKNGSHAKLAQVALDTTAEDPGQEAERALAELERKGKENI